MAKDQAEYPRQYDGYEARFLEIQQRMADIEAKRVAMTAKRGQIMVYLGLLKERGLVRSFDEALWYGTAEQVRISESEKMKFIFKDSTEIEG